MQSQHVKVSSISTYRNDQLTHMTQNGTHKENYIVNRNKDG